MKGTGRKFRKRHWQLVQETPLCIVSLGVLIVSLIAEVPSKSQSSSRSSSQKDSSTDDNPPSPLASDAQSALVKTVSGAPVQDAAKQPTCPSAPVASATAQSDPLSLKRRKRESKAMGWFLYCIHPIVRIVCIYMGSRDRVGVSTNRKFQMISI